MASADAAPTTGPDRISEGRLLRLASVFVLLSLVAAVGGTLLVVGPAPTTGWADVGKALLSLAVALFVGGAATVVVKRAEEERDAAAAQAERAREERASWAALLSQVVEVHETAQVARRLIATHQSARTYRDQHAALLAARLTLRRVWFDPLVANDAARDTPPNPGVTPPQERTLEAQGQTADRPPSEAGVRDELHKMMDYLDQLGAEYATGYLPVARQQRVDEAYLDLRCRELAARRATGGGRGVVDESDPVLGPTPAWGLLLGNAALLKAFIGKEFEASEFLRAYVALKLILERKAGFEPRRSIDAPPPL